jgi:hypothetical protein
MTVQGPLEVRIREDGNVVWITTKEGTVFRACQISHLVVYDDRSRGVKTATIFPVDPIE